jgi:cytochrome c oxidase cbb3-type subunit 2
VRDIFRTMTTGLNGTPMPSFIDSMKEEERWAISYFVLSLSAFTDPLTGQRLRLDAQTQAMLNRPETGLDARYAYEPTRGTALVAGQIEFHRYRFGLRGGPKE